MSNLSNYIYNLIDKNIGLLDMGQYENNFKIHIEYLEDYKRSQPCAIKYLDFIKRIYESVRYVDCDEVIKIYEENAKELIKIMHDNPDIEPIYIFTPAKSEKSNFYLNLYFLNLLKTKGVILNKIYERVGDVITIHDAEINIINDTGKKILLILTDDITYSGTQLNSFMTDSNDNVSILNDKIHYYLNLIGYSKVAKTKILGNKLETNIIFPINAIHEEIKTFEELLTSFLTPEISTIDDLILNNDLYRLNEVEGEYYIDSYFKKIYNIDVMRNKPLIYPFFKYPDKLSLIQNLCFIINISGIGVDMNLIKLDNKVNLQKVDDILHPNFIYTYCERYKLLMNEELKENVRLIKSGIKESDINWLIKCNNINDKPYQGKVNLGYLTMEKNLNKDVLFDKISGIKLMDGCDYSVDEIFCYLKCNVSFYKKIIYKNLDESQILQKDKIGYLFSKIKENKNYIKFIIKKDLNDIILEYNIEDIYYLLPNKKDYDEIINDQTGTRKEAKEKIFKAINYLSSNYDIIDYNNTCIKLFNDLIK